MFEKPNIVSKFTFKKSERLSSKKYIKELFDNGSSFYIYPFKMMVLANSGPDINHNQILITVPKRIFKRAVDRNKIKRLIREAYRLNKHQLINGSQQTFRIGYIYTAKVCLSFNLIQEKLKLSLDRIIMESMQP